MELQVASHTDTTDREFSKDIYPSFNITRQEIMALSKVLGRISQSFISVE